MQKTNLHFVATSLSRERWIPFHLCPTIEDGLEVVRYMRLVSSARIDYLFSPPDQPPVERPTADIFDIERSWFDPVTRKVIEPDLVSQALTNPEKIEHFRMHGIAYSEERLVMLARSATRFDVEACIYNFQNQPALESLQMITRITQGGTWGIMCNMSVATEENFMTLLDADQHPTELCRWKKGEALALNEAAG